MSLYLEFYILSPTVFHVRLAVEDSSSFLSMLKFDLCVCCFDALVSRSPSRGPNNF